jgi:dGTPase
VRDGILRHTKGKGEIHHPGATLESQTVRISDLIAYLNHDIDDAQRAGVIRREEIPEQICAIVGTTHGQRINTMVHDVVLTTLAQEMEEIVFSPEMLGAATDLREFLYQQVYENPMVHNDFVKANKVLEELHAHFVGNEDWFRTTLAQQLPNASVENLAADFIAGMTDRYALTLYQELFIPSPWTVR